MIVRRRVSLVAVKGASLVVWVLLVARGAGALAVVGAVCSTAVLVMLVARPLVVGRDADRYARGDG